MKVIYSLLLVAWVLSVSAITVLAADSKTESPVKTKKVMADKVYKNGFVYTVDAVLTQAEAFAVKDGKFIAVGSNDDMKGFTGKNTKIVSLKGKMVMPGLIDSHIHALRGALTALGLAFPVTSSVDEIKAAIKKYIADKKLKKGDSVHARHTEAVAISVEKP